MHLCTCTLLVSEYRKTQPEHENPKQIDVMKATLILVLQPIVKQFWISLTLNRKKKTKTR